MTDRPCGWCMVPIRATARRDALYCSQRCRQAAHRMHRPARLAAQGVAAGHPRRFAYADPPYPGQARRYYRDHADYSGEVDHAELLSRLASSYDGWALSTSAAALPDVLRLCPPGTRVAAWFRGERPTLSYGPLNGWEPVIYFGARAQPSPRNSPRRVDALVYAARPRLTDPRRVVGAKPAAFCAWLFRLLGLRQSDTFEDLYPGSGGVLAAWAAFRDAAAARDTSLAAVVDTSRRDLADGSRRVRQVEDGSFTGAVQQSAPWCERHKSHYCGSAAAQHNHVPAQLFLYDGPGERQPERQADHQPDAEPHPVLSCWSAFESRSKSSPPIDGGAPVCHMDGSTAQHSST